MGNSSIKNGCPNQTVIAPGYRATYLSQLSLARQPFHSIPYLVFVKDSDLVLFTDKAAIQREERALYM